MPPFLVLAGVVLCARAVNPMPQVNEKNKIWVRIGTVLFAYSILLFIYFYRTSGGASSVGGDYGRRVAKYKSQIIRQITEDEYQMFPNLWTRAMSAWIGTLSVFGIMPFVPLRPKSDQPG
jgi:hypothetical protein